MIGDGSLISRFGESHRHQKFGTWSELSWPLFPRCIFMESDNIVRHMSSRLQPRRSVKTVLSYYEDTQESGDDHGSDGDHAHSAPDPRRGKTKLEWIGSEAKQTRRRRSGKLSKFPAMPLDVMYEVGRLLPGQRPCLCFRSPRSSRCSTLGTC